MTDDELWQAIVAWGGGKQARPASLYQENAKMNWLSGLMGVARGYRTYILMGVAILIAGANYAVGDADLSTTIGAILTALGLGTAAVHESK